MPLCSHKVPKNKRKEVLKILRYFRLQEKMAKGKTAVLDYKSKQQKTVYSCQGPTSK